MLYEVITQVKKGIGCPVVIADICRPQGIVPLEQVAEIGNRRPCSLFECPIEQFREAVGLCPDNSLQPYTAGRYVIPNWYAQVSHLAYASSLHFPEQLPLYGRNNFV